MKFDWGLLFYIAAFTAFLVACFNWNYEMTEKVFLVWGISSIYIYILIPRLNRYGKKKKAIPSYIE